MYIKREDALNAIRGNNALSGVNEYIAKDISDLPAADVVPREDYHTDHGYIWLCPECGLPVHSDNDGCPRCGHKKNETWRK